MDELDSGTALTVGQQLRAAREAKGLTIEEIASQTRIPTRHLQSLEDSDWDRLPAPTYSMGFAKNYAGAVGLDKAEVADALRLEMGSLRPAYPHAELFEPADPKRVMPMGVVLGALAALLVVALLFTWLSRRELEGGEEVAASDANVAAAPAPAAAAPISAAAVVVTASEQVWVDIRDGATILKQGEMRAGESFEVPPNAVAPTLSTARPEALRIAVGTADAPPVGPAGRKVDKVSLKAADLMKTAAPAAPAPAPAATTPPARRPAAQPTPRRTPPPPAIRPAPVQPPAEVDPVLPQETNAG